MEEQKDLIKNLIENDKAKPVKDLIISKIEEGQTFKDACVLSGISETTGHRWKAFSNEEKERLESLKIKKDSTEIEKVELQQLRERVILCESFGSRVEAGIITYKEKLIKCLNMGSLKDYRAALEILRVRFPTEWNVVKRIEHSGKVETSTKEIAELLQQVLREDGPKKNKVHSDVS